MKQLKFILITLVLASSLYSQEIDTTRVYNELKGIYSNLEYNTSAFDNMKKRWVINDPELIRDLSNRFIANNYVKIDGKNTDQEFINRFNEEIYDGKVVVSVRKRYFDDEVEYFAFVNADESDTLSDAALFDPAPAPF